jgi:ISXO2-like transposase domain/Transposase zinc-ribbon domain
VTRAFSSAEQSLECFREDFGGEGICAEHLSKMRWSDGFVCDCRDRRAWFLKSRAMYECIGCGHQTSITSGTAMHGSKLPLTVWFCAAHLITEFDLSVREWAKLLNVSYKAAWRLRCILLSFREAEENTEDLDSAAIDQLEPLEGLIEVDDMEITSREQLSGGAEFQRITIAVALEVTSSEKASSFKGRMRLATIPDGSAKSISEFVQANVKAGATLVTDGDKSYRELDGYRVDPRYYEKQLPHTQRVFASIREFFKTDYLDRDAVDRGLEYIRAKFEPQNPHDGREPFETLIRLALRAEPDSKASSKARKPTAGASR